MSKFGRNLKKIRKVKKLSQTAFADIFKLTRASVGAYEEERAEPRIDTIISIANYFSVPVEDILTKELTVNDIYNFDIFKEDLFADNKTRKTFFGNNVMVPFLSREQIADYLRHLEDTAFMDKLPYMSVPFPKSGIGLAIEHDRGDMMFNERGIYEGDILFCSRLGQNFSEQVSNRRIYLVVADDAVFVRRVVVRSSGFLLIPDNPNYETVSLPVEKIKQLWMPKVKMSRHVNQIPHIAAHVDEIDERLQQIEQKIRKLEK